MLRMFLVKNLKYLIGDRKITEFTSRVSSGCGQRIPVTTVQGWLTSKTGSVRAMHHLKALAMYLSQERGRKYAVDDLLFSDLEVEDRKARKAENGVSVLDTLMAGEELKGVFRITIKKIRDKD